MAGEKDLRSFRARGVNGGGAWAWASANTTTPAFSFSHSSHPSEKVTDADAAYGIFMQSYFGGRAECRIRNWEVPVCPVDFMSQYPTVNELLGNWDILTSEHLTFPDATTEVRQLLSRITLESCFQRKLWREFRFFALVRPTMTFFPCGPSTTAYSIAAKRYALYTKSENDVEIVEPRAHGLGYFYPPKDSPKDWKHETPQWIFEAWDWIMRGVLGLERTTPDWFDLPVMMKLTLSTPHHALKNLAKGPLTRPNDFMMLPQLCRFGCPENIDPDKFTLITEFSSERDT